LHGASKNHKIPDSIKKPSAYTHTSLYSRIQTLHSHLPVLVDK
jgi:hypothetical protein